jgi:hypothetical protein
MLQALNGLSIPVSTKHRMGKLCRGGVSRKPNKDAQVHHRQWLQGWQTPRQHVVVRWCGGARQGRRHQSTAQNDGPYLPIMRVLSSRVPCRACLSISPRVMLHTSSKQRDRSTVGSTTGAKGGYVRMYAHQASVRVVQGGDLSPQLALQGHMVPISVLCNLHKTHDTRHTTHDTRPLDCRGPPSTELAPKP